MNQMTHTPIATPAHRGRIALLASRWHADLVERITGQASAELQRLGWHAEQIEVHELPGAFEFPLYARRIADAGQHQALIACALVVDGGIYRHEFVAQAVIDGLMRVQLDSGLPIFSASLTPQHFHEHEVHQQFFHAHLAKKGVEAAQACAMTLAAHERLAALSR